MDTKLTMLLWSEASEETLDSQAEKVYSSLIALSRIDNLVPTFETAKKKKNVKKFDLSYENVKKIIEDKRDKQFPALGSTFSFFSSLSDKDSSSISFSVGITDKRFSNTFVLEFHADSADWCISLFKELVLLNDPYFGCITNSDYMEYFSTKEKKPLHIFWINYWKENIAREMGIPNDDELCKQIKTYAHDFSKLGNGYYCQSKEMPFDELDSNMDSTEEISKILLT